MIDLHSHVLPGLEDDELAHWLTVAVPRAIVEGGALPPRPEPRRRRLFGR